MNRQAPISRVARTKAEAKASYDSLSRWYDTLAGSSERKYKEAGLRKLNVGAGEIVLNSIDTDGVKRGFDLPILRAVCDIVGVPVIASGGAGGIADFITLFREIPKVDAGLAASIFHFGEVSISDLKQALFEAGITVRR